MLDNLNQLHVAIIDGLRAKLPEVVSISAYPDIRRSISRLPVILIELSDFEAGSDPGTGEASLVCRIQAYVVVDPNRSDAQMQVRELSARVAAAIRGEDWGLPIGIARFGGAGEDGMTPELDSYLVWTVGWTHEVTVSL